MAPKRSPVKASMLTKVKRSSSKQEIKVKRSCSRSSLVASKDDKVVINRAPVLTLWMKVCLKQLGQSESNAFAIASVVTGRCAQAKGKALGVFGAAPAKKPAAKAGDDAAADTVKIAGHVIRKPADKKPAMIKANLQKAFKGQPI